MAARILIVTNDTIGVRMAGPAIRCMAMAADLARAGHPVELITTKPCDLPVSGFTLRSDDTLGGLKAAVGRADVVIFQGWAFAAHPWIWDADVCTVADLYDPLHLEALEQAKDQDEDFWWAATANALTVLRDQTAHADFFLCASERQRALWLGHLAAEGRINPATYGADPTLRNLLDVVPFGTADEPPQRTGPGLRGVDPRIGPDDKVILWGGGLYEWFDPLTLIDALDRLRHRVPDVRLVFMGVRHPSPDVPDMPIVAATRARIAALGLEDHVIVNERWIPYDERQNVLLDADVGVTTHREHVETDFSFRTRVLDYLWTATPIVTTTGDVFADLVAREGLGAAVPYEDAPALADALERLLTDADHAARCRANIEALRPSFTWTEALAPLRAYCADPHRAADLADPRRAYHLSLGRGVRPRGVRGLVYDARLAAGLVRDGGLGLLLRRAAGRVLRLAGRAPAA